MIGQDLRYAFRTLVKQRGFTAVAVLTLAIALAANTAIFSVVNAILLRPLPYPNAASLMNVTGFSTIDGGKYTSFSYPNYRDVATQVKSLEHVVAYTRSRAFLMEGDEPELMTGLDVTHNLPEMLGVRPKLGRFFNASEDREGGPKVMVISHELWKRKLNGDKSIIGRAVRFGSAGKARVVVGVMPEGFRFPAGEGARDYFTPFEEDIDTFGRTTRDAIWLEVAAKMRPGTTLEQAKAELDTLSKRLEAQYPATNPGVRFTGVSMHEQIVHDVRPALLMLFGAVAVVLLIGCANVANLLLARATARHREISVRAALGATRGRITRQLLAESVLLSIIAGTLGLLLTSWGIDALLAFAPPDIPLLNTVSLNWQVMLFTAGLAIFTGIAFGLAPAISASRTNLNEALKEGTRGSTEGRGNRLRSILVVAAVALSLMLLAGAGLLMRSFLHVTNINAGYDHRNTVVLEISPRSSVYDTDEKLLSFGDRLLQALRALPGVESVGAVDTLPLTPNETFWTFAINDRPPAAPGREPSAKVTMATPNFFGTMRIPLIRGRDFSPNDRPNTPRVAIVNQAFAREFFPNQNPVGKRLTQTDKERTQVEIIGVVGDVRWRSLTTDAPSTIFYSQSQTPRRYLSIVVRGPNAESLAPTLRATVRDLDRQQPIVNITTLAAARAESLAARRFNLILLGVLAVVALVLAGVGIFSVMSYSVTQRTNEIGIRMALGAEARDVFRLVVGHSARLVAIGTVIGVVGSLLASRALTSLLYGIRPTDPWTFIAIVIVLTGTAMLASYLPARRAAHVDPLVAIRYD